MPWIGWTVTEVKCDGLYLVHRRHCKERSGILIVTRETPPLWNRVKWVSGDGVRTETYTATAQPYLPR